MRAVPGVTVCAKAAEGEITSYHELLSSITYLIMSQSDPANQILWDSQDVAQDIDLEFIKRLIYRRLQQRL